VRDLRPDELQHIHGGDGHHKHARKDSTKKHVKRKDSTKKYARKDSTKKHHRSYCA
jgi:hypothetical protein